MKRYDELIVGKYVSDFHDDIIETVIGKIAWWPIHYFDELSDLFYEITKVAREECPDKWIDAFDDWQHDHAVIDFVLTDVEIEVLWHYLYHVLVKGRN